MANPLQLPPLLYSLINAEFTAASRNDEDGKSFICVDCISDSLSMREKEEHHKMHKVFQAVQILEDFCYRKKDIKSLGNKVLDVSDICVYTARNTPVYYPKKRSKAADEPQNTRQNAKGCLCCDDEIEEVGLFCSILCKLQWTADDMERRAKAAKELQRKNRKREKENVGESSKTGKRVNKKAKKMAQANSEEAVQTKSYRKRSRKGKPCRAPFF